MNALRHGEQDALTTLCSIFGISPALTAGNPRLALACLSMLFVMPMIPDKAERRRFGNSVLQLAHRAATPLGTARTSQFHHQVAGRVILMQEFPGWHGNFRHDEDELLRKHEACGWVVTILSWLGIGAVTGAANTTFASLIESGSASQAAKTGVQRFAGMSDVTDAARRRIGVRSPAKTNVITAALLAGATAAYVSAKRNIAEIENIIQHRFRAGELSQPAFQAVFPGSLPSSVRKYWEY